MAYQSTHQDPLEDIYDPTVPKDLDIGYSTKAQAATKLGTAISGTQTSFVTKTECVTAGADQTLLAGYGDNDFVRGIDIAKATPASRTVEFRINATSIRYEVEAQKYLDIGTAVFSFEFSDGFSHSIETLYAVGTQSISFRASTETVDMPISSSNQLDLLRIVFNPNDQASWEIIGDFSYITISIDGGNARNVYGWGGEEQNQTQYKLDSVIGSGDSVISITGMGGYIEISGFGE